LSDLIKKLKIKAPKTMEYYVDLDNIKARTKFISRVERIVRNSLEYRSYIQFLKTNIDLNSCIFFENMSQENVGKRKKISIQLHHDPLTLYDIVDAVTRKFEEEGKPINAMLIADEVMECHYNNIVGLVPLSKTAHEMVHNSEKLYIPLNCVYGNYSEFIDKYYDYLDDSVFEKLNRKVEKTKNMKPEDFDAIRKQFTYLEEDGYDEVQKVELLDEEKPENISDTVAIDEVVA